MQNPQHQNGFTLLEMLVAISIFALIGIGTYTTLTSALYTKSRIQAHSQILSEIQKTMLVISRDISQIIPREIIDEDNNIVPALQADQKYDLEFTKHGWHNPLGRKRSELQRVAYKLDDNILARFYWPTLERINDDAPQKQILLNNVSNLNISFLGKNLGWSNNWPAKSNKERELPKAIKFSVNITGIGEIYKIFEIVDSVILDQDNANDR